MPAWICGRCVKRTKSGSVYTRFHWISNGGRRVVGPRTRYRLRFRRPQFRCRGIPRIARPPGTPGSDDRLAYAWQYWHGNLVHAGMNSMAERDRLNYVIARRPRPLRRDAIRRPDPGGAEQAEARSGSCSRQALIRAENSSSNRAPAVTHRRETKRIRGDPASRKQKEKRFSLNNPEAVAPPLDG